MLNHCDTQYLELRTASAVTALTAHPRTRQWLGYPQLAKLVDSVATASGHKVRHIDAHYNVSESR